MNDFVEQFYVPLFESPPIVKAQFMFRMLDFDEDGYLHASDLVLAQEYFKKSDELSDFGQELAKLSNYYVQVYLKSRGKVRQGEMINLHRYKDLLASDNTNSQSKKSEQASDKKLAAKLAGETDSFVKFRSCGIEEIKLKVFAEPEKHKQTSVFFASKAQIKQAEMRQELEL